jgi:hypothetical protein
MVVGALFTCHGLWAGDDPKAVAEKLESPNLAERGAAADRVLYERWKLVEALLKMLGERIGPAASRGDREIAHGVMTLLGKMRAVEAIPVLVENLSFRRRPLPGPGELPGVPGAPPSIEDNSAVAALIRIGARSLGPVARKVAESDDAATIRAGASVYCGVLEPRLAALAIKDRIDREHDPVRRGRLKRMLQAAEEVGRLPLRELID